MYSVNSHHTSRFVICRTDNHLGTTLLNKKCELPAIENAQQYVK